jgi:predicted aspartyl protease
MLFDSLVHPNASPVNFQYNTKAVVWGLMQRDLLSTDMRTRFLIDTGANGFTLDVRCCEEIELQPLRPLDRNSSLLYGVLAVNLSPWNRQNSM